MAKAPAFQFYPKDLDDDDQVSRLSIEEIGAWIRWLCKMWFTRERGVLRDCTVQDLARMARCSPDEAERCVRRILQVGVADGELDGEPVTEKGRCTQPDVLRQPLRQRRITICNRRMVREEQERRQGAERVARFREKGGGDPDHWTAIRVKVLERDNGTCAYCGKKARTVDHVIPRSFGGTEDFSNLVACCKSCSSSKNGRTPEQAGMRFWAGFDATKLESHVGRNTTVTPPSASASASPSCNSLEQPRGSVPQGENGRGHNGRGHNGDGGPQGHPVDAEHLQSLCDETWRECAQAAADCGYAWETAERETAAKRNLGMALRDVWWKRGREQTERAAADFAEIWREKLHARAGGERINPDFTAWSQWRKKWEAWPVKPARRTMVR